MITNRIRFPLLLALAGFGSAHAEDRQPGPQPRLLSEPSAEAERDVRADSDQQSLDDLDALIAGAANHPNERYRFFAAKAAALGNWGDAAKSFRLAARYGDKYSQHRLSMLHWHGVGVPGDRVQAYIWADLAAERGYPEFLAVRERMWAGLTAEEQARVPERGRAFYAEFGDAAAKPRFDAALGQGRQNVTGSRTGFANRLYVTTRGSGNDLFGGLGGSELRKMYDASRMDPNKYWAFEDKVWKEGLVTVGEVESAPKPATEVADDADKPAEPPRTP